MEVDSRTCGKWLEEFIIEYYESARAFAAAAGKTETQISNYVTEFSMPGIKVMTEISHATGISPTFWMLGLGPKRIDGWETIEQHRQIERDHARVVREAYLALGKALEKWEAVV